jgi:hypothetical protein
MSSLILVVLKSCDCTGFLIERSKKFLNLNSIYFSVISLNKKSSGVFLNYCCVDFTSLIVSWVRWPSLSSPCLCMIHSNFPEPSCYSENELNLKSIKSYTRAARSYSSIKESLIIGHFLDTSSNSLLSWIGSTQCWCGLLLYLTSFERSKFLFSQYWKRNLRADTRT